MARTTHWLPNVAASSSEELRTGQGRRVDRDLVGASVEYRLCVVHGANAPADREGHEDIVGGAPGQLDHRPAPVCGGRDIQEDQLIGARGVVACGQLDGVAGIAQVEKAHPLDHPAGVDVKTGNDALVMHQFLSSSTCWASATSKRPS